MGDIPAPSLFKVNSRSGDIAIKTDLKTDDAFEYTVSSGDNETIKARSPKIKAPNSVLTEGIKYYVLY